MGTKKEKDRTKGDINKEGETCKKKGERKKLWIKKVRRKYEEKEQKEKLLRRKYKEKNKRIVLLLKMEEKSIFKNWKELGETEKEKQRNKINSR